MIDLLDMSVSRLADLISTGRLGRTEVVESFRRRAEAAHQYTGCFIAIEDDPELGTPALLPSEMGRALEGVPFAAKDIFSVPGRAPTAGMSAAGLSLRGKRSFALERLRDAGAVSLGWLNMDPLAYAALGTNPEYGATRNPWDTTRISGGSSSGAAAAVACRAVPFAIGSDTGGSTRIPAAFCGVVGFKPTFGSVPRVGAVPLSYSQDTIGVLAKTAEDVAAVMDVIAEYDPADPASFDVPVRSHRAAVDRAKRSDRPLQGVRVGADHALLDIVVSDRRPALAGALRCLTDLGATVVDLDLTMLADFDVAATVLTWAEAGAVHLNGLRRRAYEQTPTLSARLQATLLASGVHHVDAMRYQGVALNKFLADVLSQADLIATPCTPGIPPPIEEVLHASDRDALQVNLSLLTLNRPFNFLGLPAVSMPVGFDPQRLPVGLQLAAGPWRDAELLQAVAAYQVATDWHTYRPPIQDTVSQRALPSAGEPAAASPNVRVQ